MQNLLGDYKTLDPLARGLLFQKLKEKQGVSYQEISRRLQKSPAYIVNSVRLLNLPIAVKDGLLGGLISEGHARALIPVRDQRECVEIYKKVLRAHASVREVEEMVRQKVKGDKEELAKRSLDQIKTYLERFFKESFSEVKIKTKRGKIEIVAFK